MPSIPSHSIPLSPARIAEKLQLWLQTERYDATARTTKSGLPCIVVKNSTFKNTDERKRVWQTVRSYGYQHGTLDFVHPAKGWTTIVLRTTPIDHRLHSSLHDHPGLAPNDLTAREQHTPLNYAEILPNSPDAENKP